MLLPELVSYNPITNQINFLNYVGYHLYYPLFYIDENSQMSSEFLDLKKTKAINYDYKSYKFCLKDDLKFSDGSFVTSEDMMHSLNQFSNLFPKIIPKSEIFRESSKCAILKMSESTTGLFKRLTGISSTILKKSTFNDKIPIGIGPYKLLRFDNNALELDSANKVKYNKVSFYSMSTYASKGLNIHNFQDFNNVSTSLNTDKIDFSDYQVYENSIDKVYSIVLNIRSDNERVCAYQILSKLNWHLIYGLTGASTKNFLPWDVKPYVKSVTKVKCKSTKKIQVIVPSIFDFDKVSKNFKIYSKGNLVTLVNVKNEDFGRLIFSKKPYIALIGFDSATTNSISELNYDVYFDSFILDKNRLVSQKLSSIEKLLSRQNVGERNNEFLANKYSRAEALLLGSKYVIPVTRNQKKFYYKTSLKINKWFDRVNGVVDARYVD